MKTVTISAGLDGVKKRKAHVLGHDLRTQLELKIMLWPAILLIAIFQFIPLFGLLMAFKRYDPFTGVKGIFTSPWSGFENFAIIFDNFQFWPMLKNTVGINLFGSLVGLPVTLLFALLLNEITSTKFKSLIQTVTYLPHFLSWVIYGGLFITILNPQGGIVNYLLMELHLVNKPIQFLSDPSYFWGLAIGTGLLKDIGWGAILYLAAIAGVDQVLVRGCRHRWCGPFQTNAAHHDSIELCRRL